jgi:hypothetical protein
MSASARVRSQNWSRLTAQLTAWAFKRTQQRSWDLAQDLAYEAITQLYENPESWDPDKEPILKHLAKRVIGLASNEWRRKRNSFEVAMETSTEWQKVAGAGDAADEELDRLRLAESFRERLAQRLEGDEAATMVVAQMLDEVDSANDQARETEMTVAQIREARRRVFYHAEQASKELAREIDQEEEEVAQ